MRGGSILKSLAYVTVASITFGSTIGAANAQNLPTYMQPIAGLTPSSAGETATKDVLALNTGMFELYGDAAKVFKKNILAQHPVILGLFSGAGGRFILYRPGMAPLEAPQVPVVYQLLKSIGHSTMALTQVVGPYLDNPITQNIDGLHQKAGTRPERVIEVHGTMHSVICWDCAWRGPMQAYRSRMKSALDELDATPMQVDWRDNNRTILKNNIAFMDDSLAEGAITFAALQAFAKKQAPFLKLDVAWAAQTQVAHWMSVLSDWKAMIGSDWEKTYAASNTIYVARQNNVLFSVLAQFFGPDAINSRLILIETISFTTTPDDMLGSLTRIIADRSVGSLFFGNYHLMDYELMGGDARAAIIAESAKRGTTAFLPPPVPFGSKQWPTLVTPGPGPTSIADLLP